MSESAELTAARRHCNDMYYAHGLKSDQYAQAFDHVAAIVALESSVKKLEEFCSVDSGVHRTRLLSGKIVS